MRNHVKIDEIDAKILRTLLKDARTSFTEIAQDCKISVGAVRMRYKRLWKTGIINGEIMLVNPHSLGYKYIIDIAIVTALENEKAVKEFLSEKPYIRHVVGPMGKYNFWTKVALHDVKMLAEILGDIESNPLIEHVDALIWAEAVNIEHVENLRIEPLPVNNTQKLSNAQNSVNLFEAAQIDETDRKIAAALTQNARLPFSTIAEQLGISTKNVIKRYQKLKERVLPHATITVDLNKLGYKAFAHMFLRAANRSKLPEICAQMLQIPNMIVMIRLLGAHDLYTCFVLADFEDLFKLKQQIRTIQGIARTETSLSPIHPAWPFHLFPSLLKGELMEPKFWGVNSPRNSHS
ncbi:MAG: Lrp/AsnC family transcriptional regulator [Candidatus Bathyarchaeota archaeon]|nr:Lrp/AsnC family transcriptional regulator [Candidatus Bathyarchaeota archaeon]